MKRDLTISYFAEKMIFMLSKTQIYIKIIVQIVFWVSLVALLNSPALNLDWGQFSSENGTLLIPLIYGMAFNIFLLYINIYWMIPAFLHKKRHKSFWGFSVLLLVVLTVVEIIFDFLYYSQVMQDGAESLAVTGEIILDIGIWAGSVFFINIFYWAMAFLYRFPKDWKRNERTKQQLVQDKLTAELDFLKAQINPHFLFNGINSIYHLIGSDDTEAKKVLLQFSELLRYQLYECEGEFILLKKEISYIRNYILLEEVRKGQDAIIKLDIPEEDELTIDSGLKIAPLILTPFLENAFKYLSLFSEIEKNQLFIQIQVFKGELSFFVENTIDPNVNQKKKEKTSGIGLENVKRRLLLLYPQKHNLKIESNNDRFSVTLKIDLK